MCRGCEGGDYELMRVASKDSTIAEEDLEVAVDRCIAPMVGALQEGGVGVIASCCGHGREMGQIDLVSGRTLFVVPTATLTASQN